MTWMASTSARATAIQQIPRSIQVRLRPALHRGVSCSTRAVHPGPTRRHHWWENSSITWFAPPSRTSEAEVRTRPKSNASSPVAPNGTAATSGTTTATVSWIATIPIVRLIRCARRRRSLLWTRPPMTSPTRSCTISSSGLRQRRPTTSCSRSWMGPTRTPGARNRRVSTVTRILRLQSTATKVSREPGRNGIARVVPGAGRTT